MCVSYEQTLFFFFQQLSTHTYILNCHWPKVMVNKIIYASLMTAKTIHITDHTMQFYEIKTIHKKVQKKQIIMLWVQVRIVQYSRYKISCVQYYELNNMNYYYVEQKLQQRQQQQCTSKHTLNKLRARNILFFYWSMKITCEKKPVLHRKFALAFIVYCKVMC